MNVKPLTCALGAEIQGVSLAEASRNGALADEIQALLLQYLYSQASIPEYQMRWRWIAGDVAIWDNRCTQHYAVMDYPPCHRRMNRATIMGDKPF